jgi:hypothetical protein
MRLYRRRALHMLALLVPLSMSGIAMTAPPAGPASDVLSGTWRVSRVCLTICTSPPPVTKVIHHVAGNVYKTGGQTPQMLLQMGRQVLVHGPKDSLLLTLDPHGRLMTGQGVAADGSTFQTTWRCISSPQPATAQGVVPSSAGATRPAQAPAAMTAC